jgi:thiol-disulfide isomerase/thioredoxin
MNRVLVIAIAAVLAVIGVTGALLLRQPVEPAPSPAATAPTAGAPSSGALTGGFVPISADFKLVAPVDGKGQPADMTPYRDKVLLVNLWATWCAPCIEELPALGKLQRELGDAGFQVVTIAIDERDPAKIEPFLAKHGADNLPVLIDRDRTIDKVAKVSALPTSLLVARDGTAKAMLTGDASWTCGKALDAVKAFIADGTVKQEPLEKCE